MTPSGRSPDRPVLAIDIGGTKLAAAIVDADGTVSHATRVPTPNRPDVDADALADALLALVADVVEAAGRPDVVGLGVGASGPMTWPEGAISPLNIPAWRGFPLRDVLRAEFPDRPVRVHNDAICVAVGEHWKGAGRAAANMLGMVVSTGVGGGLILGGHLVNGASGNAGHIGHVVVDPAGPPCLCGGRGCLEAVARGPAVVAWARDNGWAAAPEAAGRELADDARRGDEVATEALARAGRALGVAISSATYLCDLELVSIGGGLSQAGELLFGPLEATLRAHAGMDYVRQVRVVAAELGQQAGLVGAAALVHAADRYWPAG